MDEQQNVTQMGGTMRLGSQPTDNVSIALSVSNSLEGSIDVANLQFTPSNWDQTQTVTVTGVDDDIDDGDVNFTIETAAAVSNDTGYSGLNPEDVAATNADDDLAGIIVAPTSGLVTSESGDTASFTIVLTSEPTSEVAISLASSNKIIVAKLLEKARNA